MELVLFTTSLILYFTAPIVQLVLSARRTKNRIRFSVGSITAAIFLAGVVLYIIALNLVTSNMSYIGEPSDKFRCGTGPMSLAFLMVIINTIVIIITGIISCAVYFNNRKKLQHQLT